MTLGIQHVQYDPLFVVMPNAGKAAAEFLDLPTASVDVVDLHVQMNADLRGFRLGYALKGESRKRP